jgi:hypothetical protein
VRLSAIGYQLSATTIDTSTERGEDLKLIADS